MSRALVVALLTVTLSASASLADAASKALTKPKKVSASITATANPPVPLPCTSGTSYAATCPETSAACTCVNLSGNAVGSLGKGPVTGALTLDGFDASPEGGCTPFFGSLTITNTKDGAASILDVTGALCNSTPSGGTQTIGGGFDFDPATAALDGTGSLSGTIDSSGAAKLKLTGTIAPASNAASPLQP